MTGALGVVAALEMERRWLGRPKPLIEVGGIGDERAEAAAHALLNRGATALVSWGAAGGLDPELRPGTVLVPETILQSDGPPLHTDPEWRDRLMARLADDVPTSGAPIFHTNEVVMDPARKSGIRARWRAGAIDMESVGVARAATRAGVPWIAVRVVIDAADVALPAAVLDMCGDDGRLRASAIGGLVLRPRLWPGLIGLARATVAAGRAMRKTWSLAVPDLALECR